MRGAWGAIVTRKVPREKNMDRNSMQVNASKSVTKNDKEKCGHTN